MPRTAPGFVSPKFSTSITTRRGKESHGNVRKGHVEESALGREKGELRCKLSPARALPPSMPLADFLLQPGERVSRETYTSKLVLLTGASVCV